jgi:ribosomal protein S1
MRIARLMAVLAVLAVATSARADEKKADQKSAQKKADKPTFHAMKTSTVTAKVKSVDQKTRMVTLVNDDGESTTFKADNRIKNLKQVKPGDVVTATVSETLTARVMNPSEAIPVASQGSSTASAPLGAKPAAYHVEDAYVVAQVVAIDKENMVVTLKGPKGNTYPVKAREKKNVDKLAVGDSIEIHAARALALEVSTPQK